MPEAVLLQDIGRHSVLHQTMVQMVQRSNQIHVHVCHSGDPSAVDSFDVGRVVKPTPHDLCAGDDEEEWGTVVLQSVVPKRLSGGWCGGGGGSGNVGGGGGGSGNVGGVVDGTTVVVDTT